MSKNIWQRYKLLLWSYLYSILAISIPNWPSCKSFLKATKPGLGICWADVSAFESSFGKFYLWYIQSQVILPLSGSIKKLKAGVCKKSSEVEAVYPISEIRNLLGQFILLYFQSADFLPCVDSGFCLVRNSCWILYLPFLWPQWSWRSHFYLPP